MKKIIIGLFLAALGTMIGTYAQAQNGLENIIVEKYYVSNALDASETFLATGDNLPVGSVTYRIYADMLPGYKLQAVYGVTGHSLVLNTTTTFFNNTDNGSTPTFNFGNAGDHSIMLDSYLTIGAACNGAFGVLKTEDNGASNVVNIPAFPSTTQILQNADASAGIPLTTQDGFSIGVTPSIVNPGLDENLAPFNVFNTVIGNSFVTSNASVSVLAGVVGPTATNRVLIAQITTNGIFHYELNIQTISPTNVVQNFVASNPVSGEISLSTLSGTLGETLATQPSTIGNLTFGTTTSTSIVANFTSGNGAKRMVVARAGSAVNSNPVDAATYTATSVFGTGVQIGVDNYVVYNGTGNTFTLTGLTAGTTYHFAVYEYNDNGNSGAENYNTTTFATGNKLTPITGITYTWNQTGVGSFNYTTAANWTPARTSPATNDILVFAGVSGTVITNVPSQTVGQITIPAATNVALQGLGANTITINGNASADDFSIAAGSTLNLNGASGLTIALATGATASINGTITFASPSRLTGANANAISFKSGSTFNIASGLVSAPFGLGGVANSVVFESGSNYIQSAGLNPFQLAAPSSLVQFQAGSNQTINVASADFSGRTYGNLTLGAVVSASNAGAATIRSLVINSGASLALTNTGTIAISSNIVNNSNVATSLSITGTGTLNLNASGIQTLTGSGTGAIELHSTSGTTNIASGTTFTVSKNITFNNLAIVGSLASGAANLTHTINGAISGAGFITPLNTNDLSLDFQNPSAGSIGTLNITGGSLKNFTLNRTGTHTLASTLRVFGVYTPVTGTLVSNGNLIISSNASATGQIANGIGAFTGNVVIERFIGPTAYNAAHYVTSPISNPNTVSANYSDDYTVVGAPSNYQYVASVNSQPTIWPNSWYYNSAATATGNATKWFNAIQTPMIPGAGFSITTTGSTTIDVAGTPQNTAVSVSTTPSENNLIGNPYPSSIDVDAFLLDNAGRLLYNAVYYFNNGNYVIYAGSNLQSPAIGATQGSGVNARTIGNARYMGHSNGFWVVTNSAPAATSISFANTQRNTLNGAGMFFNDNSSNSLIRLKVKAASEITNYDECILGTKNNSEIGVDMNDVEKLMFNGNDRPYIYSIIDGRNMAFNFMSANNSNTIIPLGVIVPKSGNWTIGFDELNNEFVNEQSSLMLEDRSTNPSTFYDLKENSNVTFNLLEGNVGSRFFIHVGENNTAVKPIIQSSNDLKIFSNDGNLFVDFNLENNTNSTVELLNVAGQSLQILNTSNQKGLYKVNTNNISTGTYLVKATLNNEVRIQKVFINKK